MMNNTMRTQCKLKKGDRITGKWNVNEYTVIKELGYGANGVVYLVESKNQPFALKLSDNGTSIISEMNTLKSFSKVHGSAIGPYFLEADDFQRQGSTLPFYVMEYIKGEGLLEFIEKKGAAWIGVLMLQLLTSLVELHKHGWVFGDLKPENLIVSMPAYQVRCVDVGGTTAIGRAIKEFTEFFDRGYWGLGSRKADPSYDLFAVAMIMLNAAYPTRFSKKGEGYMQLKERIIQKQVLKPYRKMLEKALLGKYTSAEEMRQDLITILSQPSDQLIPKTQKVQKTKPTQSTKQASRLQQKTRQKKKGRFVETFVLVAVISLLYALYMYDQLL
ncbi:serine/threonine protein kinase [Peribacillus asahii]|uniref:serine/threonine protein kinase n=1 Tax=Peribacillus asahii TaxID=228899 RepID=UPI00382A9295